MVSCCFPLVRSGGCPERSDLSEVIAIQPHRVRKSHINARESGQVVTVPGTALTSSWSASTWEAKTKCTDGSQPWCGPHAASGSWNGLSGPLPTLFPRRWGRGGAVGTGSPQHRKPPFEQGTLVYSFLQCQCCQVKAPVIFCCYFKIIRLWSGLKKHWK